MFRFASLAGLVAAGVLAAGCSSHSGISSGLSFGIAPAPTPDPRATALVLSAPEGSTWMDSATAHRQPLKIGMVLPEGAVVESGGEGGVQLRLPGGGGTLTLASQTRIILNALGAGGPLEIWVSDGRVEGGLTGGSLTLMNGCGSFLSLTPMPGETAPFSFGNTLPEELWDAMIGLGLNPDMMLPPLASEALLGRVPQTFIGPVTMATVVPEPQSVALLLLGFAAVGMGVRRNGSHPR